MMIPLDDEGDDPNDDAAAAIDADDEKRIQFDCRTQLRSSWGSGSQCNNAIARSRCNSLIHVKMRALYIFYCIYLYTHVITVCNIYHMIIHVNVYMETRI